MVDLNWLNTRFRKMSEQVLSDFILITLISTHIHTKFKVAYVQ